MYCIVLYLFTYHNIATFQHDVSQHCWAQHVQHIWPQFVATCWVLLVKSWPFSNLNQQYPTCGNMVAKRKQPVVPNNVAICCGEMWRSLSQGFTLGATEDNSSFWRIEDLNQWLCHSKFQSQSTLILKLGETISVSLNTDYYFLNCSEMRYGDLEMFLCGLELTHLLPTFQVKLCFILLVWENIYNHYDYYLWLWI